MITARNTKSFLFSCNKVDIPNRLLIYFTDTDDNRFYLSTYHQVTSDKTNKLIELAVTHSTINKRKTVYFDLNGKIYNNTTMRRITVTKDQDRDSYTILVDDDDLGSVLSILIDRITISLCKITIVSVSNAICKVSFNFPFEYY